MSADPNGPEAAELPEHEVEMDDGDVADFREWEAERLMIATRSNALDTMVVCWVSQVSQCHEILVGTQRGPADEPWKEQAREEESSKVKAAHEKVRLAAAAKLIRLLGEPYDVKAAWLSPIPEADA